MANTELSFRLLRPAEGFYTSELSSLDRWPIRTFLPTGYEPNYPYPLLVFFHGQGGCEEQILRLAPRMSRRNFICIGLRGPVPVGARADGRSGYSWGQVESWNPTLEDYVFRAIEQTRRSYHVHSERVYLTGFCEGSSPAYRLGLAYPERFGGVISLNGCLPRQGAPLLRYAELRGFRVYIGHGIANAVAPLSLARSDHRLLYTAGLSVQMHQYPTTHRIHVNMLRDVNRWVMGHVNSAESAASA